VIGCRRNWLGYSRQRLGSSVIGAPVAEGRQQNPPATQRGHSTAVGGAAARRCQRRHIWFLIALLLFVKWLPLRLPSQPSASQHLVSGIKNVRYILTNGA